MTVLPLETEIQRFPFTNPEGNGRVGERSMGHFRWYSGRRAVYRPGFSFGQGFGGFVSARSLLHRHLVGFQGAGFWFFIGGSGFAVRQNCQMSTEQGRSLKFVIDACGRFDRLFEDAVQQFKCFCALKVLQRSSFGCFWIGELRETGFPVLRFNCCEDIRAVGKSRFRSFNRIA